MFPELRSAITHSSCGHTATTAGTSEIAYAVALRL